MLPFKKSNDLQKAGFNRAVYGFALLVIVGILAVNRLVRMNPMFIMVDMQLLVTTGVMHVFLSRNSSMEPIRALSLNLWVVAESLRNVIKATGRPLEKRSVWTILGRGVRCLFVGIFLLFFIAFGVLQLPLILVELMWGFSKRKLAAV